MENLSGIFKWGWNCGSKNDIDVVYFWGDNGNLTLKREYLGKIVFKWRFCNSIDGWIEDEKVFELSEPSSEPYTFSIPIKFYTVLGKNRDADPYFGKKYKVESSFIIISEKDEIIDEEYSNQITGCFIRRDANFDPAFQPDCIPPDIDCADASTVCD
ncbi:MAG: hypothetical protein ACPL25_05325 [Ignavibacteria bacterium]